MPDSLHRVEDPPGEVTALEIRVHGRGGQGGVTCAKILAAVYANLGRSVQTFGDYAGERSGAPVRAYTRVADRPIENRNKVYQPDHLLVLDPTLLGPDTVAGLAPGGVLLVNTPERPDALAQSFGAFRVATVDATAIARRHGIGTRSVVIVNTTIAGAFARAAGLPLAALEEAYDRLGLRSNLAAAREAWGAVAVRAPDVATAPARPAPTTPGPLPFVLPLADHREGAPTGLRTGNWRSQTPRFVAALAPCSAFCPAGNDVVGFVQALAREGADAAADVLARTTPLAAVCGRVCPAPCMEGCNRREHDGAVNVRGLERLVAGTLAAAPRAPKVLDDPRRVAVVGGGPAGLAAAYVFAREGHRVTIYEGEAALGGVLHTGIPAYRLPRDVLAREVENVLALGVEARCGRFLSRAELAALPARYDAVILATGLQRARGVNAPGEGLAGVEQGLRFLHRVNVAGGARLAGHVVVLGGGNTAMDCARSAVRAGASRVTVAYRRGPAEMPAIPEEVEQAREEGVGFVFLRAPVGFDGNGRVAGVRLAEVALGPPDASGRRRPEVTDRVEALPCDAVLLALGQSADLSLLPAGWALHDGQVFADGAALGVWAAGDVSTGDGTVAHAIGDGRRAATRALRTLGHDVPVFERPDRAAGVPATAIRMDHFPRAAAAHGRHLDVASRVRTYDEVDAGLADAGEAARCFSCGACTRCDTCLVYCPDGVIRRAAEGYAVDYTFCKGCGICVTECPRHAIEMGAV